MKERWMKACGQCKETEIVSTVKEQNMQFEYYLAGYTNRYDSGIVDENMEINIDCRYLLELRVFCRESEIFFTRTRIGSEFQWRVTEDSVLQQNDFIDTEQYIDCNVEHDLDKNIDGRKDVIALFTTVGGAYHLPVMNGQNAVKIRAYIDYDDNGMAYVSDHRLCDFVKK